MTRDPKRVEAGAEKRFFIEMLTKDIELLPAIADLVDNSVDGVRHRAEGDDLSAFWIRVNASADGFEITDNAGGISADIARNYAFKFGRPAGFAGVPGSVGQFGIGMKRAIFKLGSAFEVQSSWHSEDSEQSSTFLIKENVATWAGVEDDWSFRFAELDERTDLVAAGQTGTRILVKPLHPSVSDDLGNAATINQLKIELSTRHQESLLRGLLIEVNGDALKGHEPSLQMAPELQPINRQFTVMATQGDETGEVRVRLVAGTVATPSAMRNLDEGQASNFQSTGDAGWYVFCNGRLLLAADRTVVTGWGSPAASYHPQYRTFRGYVYMESDDARFLPWNTTKTAVDRDSAVFREVASQMKVALVDTQALINRVKAERERVALLEEANVPDIPETPLVESVTNSPNVSLASLPVSETIVSPASATLPALPKVGPKIQRIQYQVEIERYDKLAKILEVSSGSELGRATFDYVWKAEVSE